MKKEHLPDPRFKEYKWCPPDAEKCKLIEWSAFWKSGGGMAMKWVRVYDRISISYVNGIEVTCLFI